MAYNQKRPLTAAVLRRLVHYNPETGVMIWRPRHRRYFKGQRSYSAFKSNFEGKRVESKHPEGYLMGYLWGKHYLVHRLAWLYMTGEWPVEVDHEDGNMVNNRWKNLKDKGHTGNMKNTQLRYNNATGYPGVQNNKPGKWDAYISHNKVKHYLGRFDSLRKAVRVRKAAERKYGFHVNHGRTAPILSGSCKQVL